MLVRAKKKKVNRGFHARIDVRPVTLLYFLAQQVCEYFSKNSSLLAVFYITSVVNCLVSS